MSAEAQFVVACENKDNAFTATFMTPIVRTFFRVNLHAVSSPITIQFGIDGF